jgi:hypothetical protein
MRALLWRAMLDSDFNSRYWRALTDNYARYDLWLKIGLAISASGSVAGWSVWADVPLLWKSLSGLAAVASIASPLLAFSKKAEVSATHAGLWSDLRVRYADLWDKYKNTGESAVIQREHDQLKKVFLSLETSEPKLKIPQNEKLAEKCQLQVLASKGLTERD